MTCLDSTTKVQKKPGEVLNVAMDFSAWLENSETLSSPSVAITPVGITVTNEDIDGNLVTFTIAGGVDGTTYEVSVTVNTSASEVLIGSGKLIVRS